MKDDYRKSRFGCIAVEKGFVTEEELVEAMELQIRDNLKGKGHRLIGTILFELGYMDVKQVDEVLVFMETATKDPLGRAL